MEMIEQVQPLQEKTFVLMEISFQSLSEFWFIHLFMKE